MTEKQRLLHDAGNILWFEFWDSYFTCHPELYCRIELYQYERGDLDHLLDVVYETFYPETATDMLDKAEEFWKLTDNELERWNDMKQEQINERRHPDAT